MKGFWYASICAALLGSARATEEDETEKAFKDPSVFKLSPSNFADAVKGAKPVLVEFYANWCGHCKNLAPEYAKAARELKDEGIVVASMDCTNHQDFCGKQEIQGYPTLRVYREGNYVKYEGVRKAAGIVRYMKKQLLPTVSKLDLHKLVEFSRADDVVVVGNFGANAKASAAFSKVAEKLRKDFVFGELTEGVMMFKKFDDGYALFEGDVTNEEELTKFIKTESIPLMDEIGPENYQRYYENKLPLAFFFWNDKESQKEKVGPLVEEALKQHRDKVNAVYIDANTYGSHAERLNLEKGKWPALVIHDHQKDLKYAFSGKDFTKDALASFFSDFAKGALKPKYKSEPVPAKNDGPVMEVVHENFLKIVGDNKKDVLLEVYAPWCGFCQKLAPVYKEIAEAYKAAKGGDKVILAKMDATKNDLPKEYGFKIEGFPTLVLYKANTYDKSTGAKEAVFYEGNNSKEDIVKFITDNAANKVVVELPKEEAAAGKEEGEAADDKEEL